MVSLVSVWRSGSEKGWESYDRDLELVFTALEIITAMD
jgi:hypothetical protein